MTDDKSTIVCFKDKDTGNGRENHYSMEIFDNEITADLRIQLNEGDDKLCFGNALMDLD
jgi:hypothetical protein